MARILLIQTAFLGDVILSTSLVEKWKLHYPDDQIDVLIRKGNEGVFENNPKIAKIFTWDKRKKKLINLISLIFKIRKNNYDKVFNLQRFFSSGLLTVFSGAKQTIGFRKNPLSLFFSTSIEHRIEEQGSPHEVVRNHQLLVAFTDHQHSLPRMYLPAEKTLLSRFKLDKPFLCIAPASVWFTKQYPEEKWIAFIQKVPKEFPIVLLGSKSDLLLCENIYNTIRQTEPGLQLINLAGKLNIIESAELIRGAKMNYVNDSAPLHIASAVNAPVCAVFCSTVPEFGFGPLSDDSHIVQLKEKLYCRPCGLHGKKSCPEGHFRCAMDIQEEQLTGVLK